MWIEFALGFYSNSFYETITSDARKAMVILTLDNVNNAPCLRQDAFIASRISAFPLPILFALRVQQFHP